VVLVLQAGCRRGWGRPRSRRPSRAGRAQATRWAKRLRENPASVFSSWAAFGGGRSGRRGVRRGGGGFAGQGSESAAGGRAAGMGGRWREGKELGTRGRRQGHGALWRRRGRTTTWPRPNGWPAASPSAQIRPRTRPGPSFSAYDLTW